MPHLRHTFTLIAVIALVGCSSPKPTPTQNNGAVYTQAFETALAGLSTDTPQPTISPTTIIETSTPLPTSTPALPLYDVGITSCEISSHSAYPGWAIYECNFWVNSKTNQTITFGDLLEKNDEKLKSPISYEQEKYLNPINSSETGVYISTTDNVSYPVDFLITGETQKIQPIRPGVPIHGFQAGISGDGTFVFHFLVPEVMTPTFIEFPKINVRVNVPQLGEVQPIPTPEGDIINSFDYKNDNGKIELSFKEFNVYDEFGRTYFSVTFNAVNKDKTAQASSEVPFPYFVIDSNGVSYDDVGHGGDKIVKIGPYTIDLGPGQSDEFIIDFKVETIPQYIYIVPLDLSKPLIRVDTQNPQSNYIASAPADTNNFSGNFSCDNFTSQLQPGMEAKVVTNGINMRNEPATTKTIVGVVYAGEKVTIQNEQPVCSEGFLWWKVQAINSGITGWAVEGTTEERWLSP